MTTASTATVAAAAAGVQQPLKDDPMVLTRAICSQMSFAQAEDETRRAQVTDPLSLLDALSINAFHSMSSCDASCTISEIDIRSYTVTLDDRALRTEISAARHMFLSDAAVAAAIRMRIVAPPPPPPPPPTSQSQNTQKVDPFVAIHICSCYCPMRVCEGAGVALFDAGDPDIRWVSLAWHDTELVGNDLPHTIYSCHQHKRFHVCGVACDASFEREHGSRVCPISRRVVTAVASTTTFGDGTGTREQIEKTTEARGSAADNTEYESTSGRNRRRRRTTATRSSVYRGNSNDDDDDVDPAAVTPQQKAAAVQARKRVAAAATTGNDATANGSSAGPATTTTSKRCKTSKAKRVTKRDQQRAVVATFTEQELFDIDPSLAAGSDAMTAKVFADVPFSERKPGRHDREFALDSLYNQARRAPRRELFAIPAPILTRILFADTHLFARYCERAAAITYKLLFGRERTAIDVLKCERAHERATKAVEQYVAARRKDRMPPIVEQCCNVYESALGTADQVPRIHIDHALASVAETYYTLVAVEFYFQFMAMPMPEQALRDTDTELAVQTAFCFDQYVPIILDLMCSDFVSDNIRLLPHDDFLLRLYMPESMTQKQLGMPDRMSTHIKRLIKQRIRSARTYGMPMRYVEATTFTWDELAKFCVDATSNGDPARTVVEQFLARRADRLQAMRRVVSTL